MGSTSTKQDYKERTWYNDEQRTTLQLSHVAKFPGINALLRNRFDNGYAYVTIGSKCYSKANGSWENLISYYCHDATVTYTHSRDNNGIKEEYDRLLEQQTLMHDSDKSTITSSAPEQKGECSK